MKDYWVLTGVVLGLLVMVALLICAAKGIRKSVTLSDGAVNFIAASSVVGGVKLIYIAIIDATLAMSDGDKVYLVLGGIALIWISVETIRPSFRPPP